MKQLLSFSLAFIALTTFAADSSSELCLNDSKANQLSFFQSIHPRNSQEITLVTWNAHKFEDRQFFYDLKELSQTSDILMVQEAMHSSAWQAAFASHFSMSFSFFKSFCNGDDQATGVMTAARELLESNQTLTSPGTEPITFTPKVSGYSIVKINTQLIHLINTHALNFNTGADFEAHIDQIAQFIAGLSGPVIWAGDFNTWNPLRKSYLNEKAKALGLTHLIPNPDQRNLILDHVYIRGLTATKTEVLTQNSSDHFPVRTILKLN